MCQAAYSHHVPCCCDFGSYGTRSGVALSLPPNHRIADRYEVISPLGRGGMATTYLVRDIVDGSQLALKLLHSDRPALVEALRFEFRTLQSVHHPNLCPVHDFGFLHARPGSFPQATCFYTAEAINGLTLDAHARDRSWDAALLPLIDALEALRLMHRVGVRHGDFKPSNVLVRHDGTGVLVDLGCARPLDSPPATQVSGTRAFLAPELLQGLASDARADLFAVGVTLQRLAALTQTPPPAHHETLIARLTDLDPAHRPRSVEEVIVALGASPRPIHPAATWRGRFVGRESQMTLAQRAVDSLLSDTPNPRVLAFVGQPGVGRTRLLQELEWLTQRRCRTVRAAPNAPLPVEDLLARALGKKVHPGRLAIVDATRELITLDERIVLLFDDVQQISDTQRRRLHAVIRSLDATARTLLFVCTTPDCRIESESLQEVPMEPLSSTDLSLWLAPTFGLSSIEAFHRLTGGYPDAVNAVVGLLRTGKRTEDDLARMSEGVTLGDARTQRFRSLARAQQRAAGLLALNGGHLGWSAAHQLGVTAESLDSLRFAGFVDRDASGWKLTRAGESAELAEILPPSQRRALHGELAEWLEAHGPNDSADGATIAEHEAARCLHLARGGDPDRALKVARQHRGSMDLAPRAWRNAVLAVIDALNQDAPLALVIDAAKLDRLLGDATRALDRLEGLAQSSLPDGERASIEVELGACHAALGDLDATDRHLRRALELTDRPDRAPILATLARAHLRRGAYLRAKETAQQLSSAEIGATDRAELLSVEGAARSGLGESEHARSCLNDAVALLSGSGRPKALVRAVTSLALHELKDGDLERASQSLQRALLLAHEHGLTDHIANLALNLGVVHHQRASWEACLESYEKGLRVARALGRRTTEAALLCNSAKAHADLGAFDHAQLLADHARVLATRSVLPLTVAAADAVIAEVAKARGDDDEAVARFLAARTAFEASDSFEELVEMELDLAEMAARKGDLDKAETWLVACEKRLEEGASKYLEGRASLARARVLTSRKNHNRALHFVERAVDSFVASGHRDACAEAHMLLFEVAKETGAPHLAQQSLAVARALWERAAASLPPASRESFWMHPKRIEARATDLDQPSASDNRLLRLLDINKRLNSSLHTDDVLRAAMDAAIELTGAERGFVLVREPGKSSSSKLTVATARNVDREQVGRSHLKFSRGIAQSVIESGQPLLAMDAATDARFEGEESVHAMLLKSVLCVPIDSPQGVLGALYLDNRFQRGLFSTRDVDLLVAFADQVALAMRNARLVDALERRNKELEAERRRVQALAEGQAAEIDRLQEQVRDTRATLSRRYDYSRIVGRSEAMQRVFDLLDRVTDTSIPVLVQGESGTGKELIARALHHNGPRKDSNLVSINCAALPEPLLESELFGHVRGAFTGADRDREGLVVRASGGTLFLDEVAELPLSMQAKLLRVLQEKEVLAIGASKARPVDFRLVSATNQSLRERVSRGAFREDLYYRLAVVELRVPALRDRAEDIPALARHILDGIAAQTGVAARELTPQAMRKLVRAAWPGNVRQLENVLTRAVLLARGDVIRPSDIELPENDTVQSRSPGRETYEDDERARILTLLERHRWNVRKVAPMLGLPRSTLYRKLQKYGIAVRPRRKPD